MNRLLYLRGVDQAQADDVVQEVAVRALAIGLPFETADDFYAWAAPVARNLHIDLMRARARTTDSSGLPGIAATTNVEHEVERRLALERVLRALATMGDADRSAILDRINEETPDAGEAGRIAVRRHRARQRLRLLVKGTLGWGGLVAVRRRLRLTPVMPSLASVALVAPVLLVGVLPSGVPHREANGAQVSPPVVVEQVVGESSDLLRSSDGTTTGFVLTAEPSSPRASEPREPAPDVLVDEGNDVAAVNVTKKDAEGEQHALCVGDRDNPELVCVRRVSPTRRMSRVVAEVRRLLPVVSTP